MARRALISIQCVLHACAWSKATYDGTVIWMAAKFVICILTTCQIIGIHQVICITSALCLCRCFMFMTETEKNL